MASRPYATTARCLCVTLVKASAIVVGALCLLFQTFETHEDDSSSDSSSDPMKMYCAVGNNQDHGIESYSWEIESRNKPVIIDDKHRAGI